MAFGSTTGAVLPQVLPDAKDGVVGVHALLGVTVICCAHVDMLPEASVTFQTKFEVPTGYCERGFTFTSVNDPPQLSDVEGVGGRKFVEDASIKLLPGIST